MATSTVTESYSPSEPNAVPVRVAPPAIAVTLYWITFLALGALENGMHRFMGRLAASAAVTLFFVVWWLIKGGSTIKERLLVLAWALLLGAVAIYHRDVSFPPQFIPVLLMFTVPPMITLWTVWLLLSRGTKSSTRRVGMFAIPVFAWAAALCMRLEGLTGIGNADIHARWNPTAEQQFLAERVSHNRSLTDSEKRAGVVPIVAGPHDWTEFRGSNRDGAVRGVIIATNWSESPPKELWRRRVGPGWSSIIVVGGRLYSQEQRGEREAVFCCDAATGEELWSHEDEARFTESMGGDGPRATPTFFDGKIYALGATGILNCLDAATGELKWTRDAAEGRRPKGAEAEHSQQSKESDPSASAEKRKTPETGMPLMYWGFASSPLVVDGNVVVFTGFDREDSLRAFRCDNGEPSWKASAGSHSYSSPQLATFDGQRQVLMLSDAELTSTDPSNGRTLWRYESGVKPGDGFPAIQPHLVGDSGVVVSFMSDESAIRLEVSRKDNQWQAERASYSMQFKPYFSDCVQYEDVLYGFEAPVFCAVDVKSGKRAWKKGRYGAGQALLLADQGVVLVTSESGEAVLLAANPEKHQELGRFQAINGKTWNHPTIVDGRLYVRNAEEMACYELTPP